MKNNKRMNESDQEEIDLSRRKFLLGATGVLGGIGMLGLLTPFLASWRLSSKAKALGAPVECDLSLLEPGQQMTVEWRGKPVWIIRRTEQQLQHLANLDSTKLRDPNSNVDQQPDYAQNAYRSRKPEYLILVGICTHLGCSPKYKPTLGELGKDWPGGFFCPCHGSTFDLAGRVFKGVPAPINLVVPPHQFVDEQMVIIGVDGQNPLDV
ncbi:MAG: ubiquinol-cytochrome c reductase iron-sulfur subunit [Legionellales bacterium]|nr:ubiquinol-cytochrome c reductase iron-sulfur subunit [Legionellales bacterium]